MNIWHDRLRLARLLVAPPPPEAHAEAPKEWKWGWAARLAGETGACPHGDWWNIDAWLAGYEACGVAMGKPPA